MPPLRLPSLIALAAVAAAAVAIAAGPPGGLSETTWRGAAVCFMAATLWATAVMPEYVTALLLFLLAMVLGLAPASVVFSGFHSGAAWMVFGGLIVGAAVVASGLGDRLALVFARALRGSYTWMLAGLCWITAALSFFLPSANGRVLILLPITLGLAERAGFGPGSTGRTGLCIAVAATTIYASAPVMTAGVPNLVLLGAAESIHGLHFSYAGWLRLHFPVLGFVALGCLPFIVRALFPATARAPADAPAAADPLRPDQRRLAAYLVIALVLWASDTVHGIAPAWIALAVAILCVVPRTGVISAAEAMQRINLSGWVYVSGIIGMGALVTHTGLGDHLSRLFLDALPLSPGHDFRNFVLIVAVGMVLALIAGTAGLPAILTPVAPAIASATGWPLETVLMAQIPSCTMGLFPYQYTPLILGVAIADLRLGDAARLMVAFTIFSWLVLVPLQYLWWRQIGMFG